MTGAEQLRRRGDWNPQWRFPGGLLLVVVVMVVVVMVMVVVG